jgi:SAM-dependent methyltransferase
MHVKLCSICGTSSFEDRAILWDELVAQWQLCPEERRYIDRQQGTSCEGCGANLRSIALSDAIRNAVGTTHTLRDFVLTDAAKLLSVLDINEAGSLNDVLRVLPRHRLVTYPGVDIHLLPYANDQFDLVVHSDTLEHVAQPVRALGECRRVLKPGGWVCFTVPTIVGRLTRSRIGLERSFHGNPGTRSDDLLVYTEFGADMWKTVLEAEFSAVTVNTVDFPAALALSARKT